MRKGLFLILVFLFKIAIFNASSEDFIKTATVCTPDRTYKIEYLYDDNKALIGYHKKTQNGGWANVEWVTWERDIYGQKTVETTNIWNTNIWKLSQEITFKYDGKNKTEELLQVADASGTLINSTRTQWTYTGGVLSKVSVEKWENNAWIPESLSEYTYNINGSVAQVTFSNYTAGSKKIFAQKFFAYNDAGQPILQTLQTRIENSDPEAFVNESRDSFIYDNGKEILKTSQKWNSTDNVWQNTVRITSEYNQFDDSTGRTFNTQTFEHFGQAWDNVTQKKYFYKNGTLVEQQFRSWIFTMWLDIFNEKYVYDENGNTQTAEFNRMFWTGTQAPQVASFLPLSYNNSLTAVSPAQTDLLSAHSINVEYANPEDITTSNGNPPASDLNNLQISVSVYPNPSADGYFYFNSREVSLQSYEVYDMFGRTIVARTKNDGFIDLNHVPAGMYNVVLYTSGGKTVKKLIRK